MTPNTPTPGNNARRTTEVRRTRLLMDTIRDHWNTSWSKDGVLYQRWEELRSAPEAGWHGMAHWIKALLAAAGLALVVLLVSGALDVLATGLRNVLTAAPRVHISADTSNGVWAVIDTPIRSYLAAHSAGLPVSASTVYTLWLLTGSVSLLLGFLTRGNGFRLTWTAWGAASAAMVWTTAPATNRTVAVAITVLSWTLASAFALRGLNLRPRVLAHIHNAAPEIRPEIHLPAQPTPSADRTVRSFPQR